MVGTISDIDVSGPSKVQNWMRAGRFGHYAIVYHTTYRHGKRLIQHSANAIVYHTTYRNGKILIQHSKSTKPMRFCTIIFMNVA